MSMCIATAKRKMEITKGRKNERQTDRKRGRTKERS